MATKDVVRVGFVGVGGVARWAHLGHLSKWENVKLAGFCDVNKEAAGKAAEEFKGKAYSDAKTMFKNEELDAVYVCLPPFAHEEQEVLAAESKLAIFVEKPLCTTLEKAQEINAAVKKNKVVSAVGYNWRACSITKKAQELMKGKTVSAAYGWWVGGMPGVAWWRNQKMSGGQLNEQTTHVVDIARYLIGGKVTSVFAVGAKGIANKKVDKHDIHDNSIALITFDTGAVVSIGSGHLTSQGYRVGIDFILDDLTITHNNGELKVRHTKGEEIHLNANKPYEEEDRAFIEAVQKNKPESVYCTYADAFETHRVTMAANESMETGKPVTL